ncbi:hypothetical protein M758_3G154300 [Ceratodon purpureus]|nr:hypothetical protein M758_3G154300 [Ceratodon purpureus]
MQVGSFHLAALGSSCSEYPSFSTQCCIHLGGSPSLEGALKRTRSWRFSCHAWIRVERSCGRGLRRWSGMRICGCRTCACSRRLRVGVKWCWSSSGGAHL